MRISINMRTVFSLVIVLLLVLTFNIATSFAQDAPQLINTINTDYVFSVAFSPDGTTIASGSRDYTVRLWDVATGSLRNTLRRDPIEVHPVYSVVFSPDGSMIASGNGDYTVHLWDVATGSLRNTLVGHTSNIYSVAFSPDGNTLASGSQDETVRLWDVATATLRNTLMEHTDIVFSVAFSPDGTTLASGSNWQDPNVRLWDANTGTLKSTLEHTNGINSVVFSPDGSTLVSAESFKVHLWDANTGTLKSTLEHTANALSVAFSPDGMTIASGNGNEVRLWDAHTGALRNTLAGHTDTVRSVAFSPDGSTLASGSGDGTVRLWQLTPTSATITFSPDSVPDQTFTVGTPVNLTLPSATGGTAPYTYTLSAIPAGLHFDTTTQLLSGTPTAATPATLATYTATDATGQTASLTFTITVTDAPTTGITFVPSVIDDLTLSVNTPMELLYLPLAEGGTPPYTYTLDPIPAGLVFDAVIQALSGTPTTVGTTAATYTATDAIGTSASLTFTIEVIGDGPGGDALDVNGDGQVTIIDLAIVALFYGTRVPVGVSLPSDVNVDGIVDLSDLIAVAQGIDAAGGGLNQLPLWEVEAAFLAAVEQAAEIEAVAGAPMGFGTHVLPGEITSGNVAAALLDVKHLATGDVHLGKELAVLSELLYLLAELTVTPETTALLPNYPNPFNPETWIPYHLSKAADVTLTVYDMRGVSVRELVLGHQGAGVYQSRGRAAYWDGRNSSGEPVASGVYFYTLTAGDFTATRKMLIRK